MPHFIRPTMVPPTYTAEVKCPVCQVAAKGDRGFSARDASPLTPGSLPLIVCLGELEAFALTEMTQRKKSGAIGPLGEQMAARFRRRFWVQLADGKPTRLIGDPLRPLPPVVKVKEKKS